MSRFFRATSVGHVLAFLALAALAGGTFAADGDTRIDPRLRAALSANARTMSSQSRGVAQALCLDAVGRPLCRVELATEEAASRFAAKLETASSDLCFEARTGRIVWLWASADGLDEISSERDLIYAALPFRPIPTAKSQGVADMRADRFQALGYRGQGVRVGVIDLGFQGYQSMLGRELPANVHTRSFYGGARGDGDITGGGQEHGAACAEVIHDVAPNAELYLANVSNDLDLERAVDWMVEEGVEVISHSLAWFVGGGDGQGPISDIVSRAESGGILWVTSAGNFANAHWGGAANDADADGVIELDSTGDESIRFQGLGLGSSMSFILLWNRWPSSADLAFAIDLRASDGTLLASSETEFADFGYAFRALDYTTAPGGLAPLLSIRRVRGNAQDVKLQLFRVPVDDSQAILPEHRVRSGSLAIPADSPSALSVGAFKHEDDLAAESLESFSSAGPTADGRMKPEILGPDAVENSVFRTFLGTSAACPHVAGAVALLLSASIEGGLYDVRLSPSSIRRLLQNEALPLAEGTRIPDAEGWGRARLVLDRPTATPNAVTLVLSDRTARSLTLVLRAEHRLSPTSLRLLDVSGRERGVLSPRTLDAQWIDFSLDDSWKAARGRYWALDPKSGASVSFYWQGSR